MGSLVKKKEKNLKKNGQRWPGPSWIISQVDWDGVLLQAIGQASYKPHDTFAT